MFKRKIREIFVYVLFMMDILAMICTSYYIIKSYNILIYSQGILFFITMCM